MIGRVDTLHRNCGDYGADEQTGVKASNDGGSVYRALMHEMLAVDPYA